MINRRVEVIAALLAYGIATPAAAGGCCAYAGCGCGWMFDPAPEILLVNQGPVASGPGRYFYQVPDPLPGGGYPHVGLVYSGYPYGYSTPWVGVSRYRVSYRQARSRAAAARGYR
jgi:hypothetical protein